ncbi:MAG: hypothetical protein DWQ05_19280 [Calditrichaeota bacterium]|nr:MAG: hypothetical protein DWQ05_19280 [Calditrichota bacterium]
MFTADHGCYQFEIFGSGLNIVIVLKHFNKKDTIASLLCSINIIKILPTLEVQNFPAVDFEPV